MHYLQTFKVNESIRGGLNKSTFRLKSQYQNIALHPDELEMPNDICTPENIIDLVKGNMDSLISDKVMMRKYH